MPFLLRSANSPKSAILNVNKNVAERIAIKITSLIGVCDCLFHYHTMVFDGPFNKVIKIQI